ncbi:hypothetical protein D3C85_867510 [compost metagenome]
MLLQRQGTRGMLVNDVTTWFPENRGHFPTVKLHRHEVAQGAVVFIRLAAQVGDARNEYRYAERNVGEGQRSPGAEHIGLGVHPGAGHAGHRVVVVDHAVVHQRFSAFDEVGVTGAGGAVGVELEGVIFRSTTQHLREQQGYGSTQAVTADQEFLTCIKFVEVIQYKVVRLQCTLVKSTVHLAVGTLKRNLVCIGIAQAIGDIFRSTPHSNQDQFVVVGDESLGIGGFRPDFSVVEKMNLGRVFLFIFQLGIVDVIENRVERHDLQSF